MNNYYTLISLVAELRYEIYNKEIREVWSSRKDQIDFHFLPEETGKLTFSAASPSTALFLDGRAALPSRNAATFFQELEGLTVAGIDMPSPSDRYIRITFNKTDLVLLFKPFSSRPNVFLLKDGSILSSFKNNAVNVGNAAPKINGNGIADNALETPVIEDSLPLKKKILAIDKRFPRGLINDVADTCDLDSAGLTELREKINTLRNLLLDPSTVSITAEGNLSLLPVEYLSHPPVRTFRSVNDAVRTLFLTKNREKRLLPRRRDLEKKILKRIAGLQKQLDLFEKTPERLEKAGTLEHFGHLLMSRPDAETAAVDDNIVVEDWAQDGTERIIPVSRGVTLIEQAQKYYEKAARIRKEIAVSGEKKGNIAKQKRDLENWHQELAKMEHPAELEKWLKKHDSDLQQTNLVPSGSQQVARPYRVVPLGDYEVWIGKSAKGNDEMLSLSHKEDIWFHVRGASGSHVIIRNQGKTDWPDQQVILKAASYAAAYSRQSGSSMVPVMIAKRKHVRKPKGALPGQVTVTKERVEMVAPLKPEIS